MPTSHYASSTTQATNAGYITFDGNAVWSSNTINGKVEVKGISAQLYFNYVKKKLGVLERSRLDRRLKSLEKAFNDAVENGQSALGEKLLLEVARETRESYIYAKGIKLFIERSDLMKHRHKIREGKISDTQFKDYTRVVPKDVLAKKKAVEPIFDGFVIFHYFNESQKDVKKMDPAEKNRMRDPILFGWIKESDRLYFIADWEDEYCDLTFDEIVDLLGKTDDEVTLKKTVVLPE